MNMNRFFFNPRYLFLILIILFSNSSRIAKSELAQTKFIVLGHLYPIMDNPIIINKLFNKIKSLETDYIFVLGDSNLHNSSVIKSWRRNFGEKVYFSPGNNEILNGGLDQFKEHVGYKETVVEKRNVRFLIGNSNESALNLINFINKNTLNKEKKKNILLLHHRIWDDTLTSAKPYQHDKSYYLKEIFSTLENNIDTIFAGNSKHQYFFDSKKTYGNQNMNVIYWVDRIANINAYSVGTGLGKPKLGFVEVIFRNNAPMVIIPHHISTDLKDPIPINKQILAPGSIPPVDHIPTIKYRIQSSFKNFLKNKRLYFFSTLSMLSGLIFGILITLLKLKIK